MNIRETVLPILFIVLISAGCESIPPLNFMMDDVAPSNNRKDAELKSLTVGFVPAAQQVKNDCNNPNVPGIFKEALQDAIDRSLVFSDDAEMKVNLSARIITCDLPAAGIAMVTTVATKYEITNRSSGDVIFSEIISTNGVVEFGFSPIGVVRMQESTNRAFRNNIGSLLWKLEDRNFSLND